MKDHHPYETPVGLPRTRWAAEAASAEDALLGAERTRRVREAVAQLPGRCPQLVAALLRTPEVGYAELADELSLPRGTLGPLRSRCLSCLRRYLTREQLRT